MREDLSGRTEELNRWSEGLNAVIKIYQEAILQADAEGVQAATLRFLALATEQVEQVPTLDMRLKQEALRCESEGDWTGAEATYQLAVTIAERNNNWIALLQALLDRGSLLALLGRKEDALEIAVLATEAARRSGLQPLLSIALETEAKRHLEMGAGARALGLATELLQLLPEAKETQTQRGRALVVRADSYLELEMELLAKADLEIARALLFPLTEARGLPGVQHGLANWWEATSKLCAREGDLRGALEAQHRCVAARRSVTNLTNLEGPYRFATLAASLQRLGVILQRSNDRQSAEGCFAEARQIYMSIHRSPEEAMEHRPLV